MKRVRMRIGEEKQFVDRVTWPMPGEARGLAEEQANNLVAQSAHALFSKRTKPNQPHNAKYENMGILK